MAKPAITKRTTKGSALTYSELDTNFQNLADATLTLTGGSTAVTADLNGNITLVAGTGITITGNDTAKTVTITNASLGANAFGKIVVAGQSDVDADSTGDTLTLAAGSNIAITTNASTDTVTIAATVTGLTNPLTSDLDLGVYKIVDNAVATVESPGLKIQNPTSPSTNAIQISPSSGTGGLFSIDLTDDRDLTIRTFSGGVPKTYITLDYDTGIDLASNAKTTAVVVSKGLFRIVPMTTAERNAITAQQGMIIFNSTDTKLQVHDGTNWVNLH